LLSPLDVEVMQGQSVRLDCMASGTPVPVVTWSKAQTDKQGAFDSIYKVANSFR
jgi:hypothetical protein